MSVTQDTGLHFDLSSCLLAWKGKIRTSCQFETFVVSHGVSFYGFKFDNFDVFIFVNFFQSVWRRLVLWACAISWASQAARSTVASRGLRRRAQPTNSLDDPSVMVAGAKVPTRGTDPDRKGPTMRILQLVP